MARMAMVPKHYSLTMAPGETLDLLASLRVHVRDWEAPKTVERFYFDLLNTYDGDLPDPPPTCEHPKCTEGGAHPGPFMVERTEGEFTCLDCGTVVTPQPTQPTAQP